MQYDLTPEERAAIRALQRLAKKWPQTLWLYSASGSLQVLRCGEDGKPVYKQGHGQHRGDQVDQDYIVATIRGISNDGGG